MKEQAEYDNDVQALVNDLKKGHEPAFDYLFTTRYEDLCRFAHAFVGSFEVAEDVVQDVFIKIWEKNIETGKIFLSDVQPDPPVFRL